MNVLPRDAMSAACRVYQIPVSKFLGDARFRHLARARQVASYVAYEPGRVSYTALADYYRRDHTSILHGVRTIRRILDDRSHPEHDDVYVKVQEVTAAADWNAAARRADIEASTAERIQRLFG